MCFVEHSPTVAFASVQYAFEAVLKHTCLDLLDSHGYSAAFMRYIECALLSVLIQVLAHYIHTYIHLYM